MGDRLGQDAEMPSAADAGGMVAAPATVRLGIVVPWRSKDVFEQALQDMTGVTPVWMVYDSEEGIREVVSEQVAACDAICFPGDLPYDRCSDILPDTLPVTVVQQSEVDLALCLLQASEQGLPLTPASIDSVDPGTVTAVARELQLDPDDFVIFPYGRSVSVDEVVAFHREARGRRDLSFVISSRSNAIDELSAVLDVPVLRAVPSAITIRQAMGRAVMGGLSRRHEGLRFAATIFRILDVPSLADADMSRVELARYLHASGDFADAWVDVRSGGADVLAFGNRTLVEQLTRGWTRLPALTSIRSELGLSVVVGIGLGHTARRSVRYAEMAANRGVEFGEPSCFVMTQEGTLLGPLSDDDARPASSIFRTNDRALAALAADVGLSVPTLVRLLNFERKLAGDASSAADLGKELKVTAPSGRRILRKLCDAGLAVESGTEQATKRGRPTKLYRLRVHDSIQERVGGNKETQPA